MSKWKWSLLTEQHEIWVEIIEQGYDMKMQILIKEYQRRGKKESIW